MGLETDWPSISTLYESLDITDHRATVRTPFESGYEQTRAKWIRGRKTISFGWKNLTEAHYNTLSAFFGTVRGGTSSFVWTSPSGSTFECRFASDDLTLSSSVSGYYSGTIKLRTV